MSSNKQIKQLTTTSSVSSQIGFIKGRIKQLQNEIPINGDFGRSALINMFTQILVTINSNVNDKSFTTQLIRKQQEIRDLQRKHLNEITNNLNRDATGTLMKLKKAYKEIDSMILSQVESEDGK